MTFKNCATVVYSSDNYSDLWDVFFDSFFKHNPDFQFGSMYLCANFKKYENKNVKTLLSGPETDFSSSYRGVIGQIREDYIFLVQEDMVIVSEMDKAVIAACYELLRSGKAVYIHDKNPIQSPRTNIDGVFGIYEKGMPYRITFTGFWNKKYLLSLLLDGESGWNFEKMGSYRSSYSDGVYYLQKELYQKVHLVAKRKWRREGLRQAKAHGMKLDLSKRPIIRNWQLVPDFLKDAYFSLVIRINWRLRLRIMNFMRKLLACY